MREVNPFEQHKGERARAPRAAEDIIGRLDKYYSHTNCVFDTQAHASRCTVLTRVKCLPTAPKRRWCHCVRAVGRCAYCPTFTSRATSMNCPAVKQIKAVCPVSWVPECGSQLRRQISSLTVLRVKENISGAKFRTQY
jgi:hypothetical protein